MKILLVVFFLVANSVSADTISIIADEWCPYNCSSDDQKKGFMVDIFTYIFNQKGHEVEYVIAQSYEKAINHVRQDKFNAIIGPTKTEAPDFIFHEHPLAFSYDVIIVPKNLEILKRFNVNELKPEDLLKLLKLGVVKGYEYNEPVKTHIRKHKHQKEMIQVVSGNRSLEYNLRKLSYHFITGLVEDQLLIKHFYRTKKIPFNFKVISSLDNYPLYIAFSPVNPKSKEYAQILSDGLEELKGTDILEKILNKYHLTESDILSPSRKPLFP